MSLQIGIVGLPNVGKSTLFNALTRAGAAVGAYPFTTIDPNRGVVPLPDRRLEALAKLVGPQQVTPATVEFVDIAGLVRGSHRGEGLGNRFLAHIREVDAIVIVARCFADPDVVHVDGSVDPVRDLEVLDLELVLADLETVQRRLEKTRPAARSRPRELATELALLEDLEQRLQRGERASLWAAEGEEQAALARELFLLTAKPRLYVANVAEEDLPDGGEWAAAVAARAQVEGAPCIVLSARLEADLASWSPEEAAEYRAGLGLKESGLEALVWAAYRLLDLITFFTIAGGREVRAWSVRRGATAPEAAGKVHSDMQRGFIRAEVIHWEELVRAGGWAAARERGLIRIEGRDYRIQDGDVCLFRFSV
ncbi:MAG: redox-regulated ATPase YchF [Anaerolineae bacterium]|nr:redox-regulated ATPase YchF [Anaerolineae bacterium]MCX8068609.1 redox-regulated ATPase YchF [Anaerolineae bacterium]MDW7992853.1 redox-regulated ATPase YchF [Anaerolineae bacterium]